MRHICGALPLLLCLLSACVPMEAGEASIPLPTPPPQAQTFDPQEKGSDQDAGVAMEEVPGAWLDQENKLVYGLGAAMEDGWKIYDWAAGQLLEKYSFSESYEYLEGESGRVLFTYTERGGGTLTWSRPVEEFQGEEDPVWEEIAPRLEVFAPFWTVPLDTVEFPVFGGGADGPDSTVRLSLYGQKTGGWQIRGAVFRGTDRTVPVQIITQKHVIPLAFREYTVTDMNFDGFPDFTVMAAAGSACFSALYLWDAAAGEFVEFPGFRDLPSASPDTEQQAVVSYRHWGIDYYRWEGRELVLVRSLEQDGHEMVLTVTDYGAEGGAGQIVFHCPLGSDENFAEFERYHDLDYHGG